MLCYLKDFSTLLLDCIDWIRSLFFPLSFFVFILRAENMKLALGNALIEAFEYLMNFLEVENAIERKSSACWIKCCRKNLINKLVARRYSRYQIDKVNTLRFDGALHQVYNIWSRWFNQPEYLSSQSDCFELNYCVCSVILRYVSI